MIERIYPCPFAAIFNSTFELGGGTLDVAVLRTQGLSSVCIAHGGDSYLAFVQHLIDTLVAAIQGKP